MLDGQVSAANFSRKSRCMNERIELSDLKHCFTSAFCAWHSSGTAQCACWINCSMHISITHGAESFHHQLRQASQTKAICDWLRGRKQRETVAQIWHFDRSPLSGTISMSCMSWRPSASPCSYIYSIVSLTVGGVSFSHGPSVHCIDP